MSNDAQISYLSDLAEISAGFPLRGSAGALAEGDTHFIQLTHVDPDADIDWSGVPKVELPPSRKHEWLTDSDIIFSARGTRTLAYPLRNTPEWAVCAPQFFVLSPRAPGTILPEFLAWQINQRPAQEYLARYADTAAIVNVKRQTLEQMPIVVPQIRMQETVVALWRAVQEERATLNQLIENRNQQLEALAIGLFEQARGSQA